MTTPNPVKVAGIAGGVGTTVLATILDGAEVDLPVADIVVARNDYRCAKALVTAVAENRLTADSLIVLLIDPARSLDADDFRDVLGFAFRVIDIPLDNAIARADDAGLLTEGRGAVVRLADKLNKVLVPA